jgi:MFS family permease
MRSEEEGETLRAENAAQRERISAFNILGIFFAQQNLHVPASFYSFLSVAFGFGAVSGAFFAGFLAQRIGVARTFWLSILALTILLLIYSRLTDILSAIVISFLFGIPNAAIGVAFGPLLLYATPSELVGRISSVIATVVTFSSIVSTALVSYLASTLLAHFYTPFFGFTFGPIDTIFTIGSFLGLLASIYAMVNLRQIRLTSEEK